MRQNDKKRKAGGKRQESSTAVDIQKLEERIALSFLSPKKGPETPPYPPGTRYSMVRRENLEKSEDEETRQEEAKPEIQKLEERIALSVISPNKKAPEPPPYPPGTLYGLVRRENIEGSEEAARETAGEEDAEPEIQRLEERIALSLISPKKQPAPPPYPPGTDYSLVRKENLNW